MDELISECRNAYAKKDYSQVRWLCNQILEEDKTNEAALTYQLYVNLKSGQLHLVFRQADEIQRLYSNNPHASNCRARAYLEKGEFEKALKTCEDALKINDHEILKKCKIEALISLDRIDEAYEYYTNNKIPDCSFTKSLIRCGKYSQISEYKEDLSDKELIDCFFKRCEYLYRRGNYKEIIKLTDEIFKIDKDNEYALEYKIQLLEHLEMDSDVLKCADYAISLYPENFRFYFKKAETLLWSFNDTDGAIKYYKMGFSIVDDFEKCWFDLDNLIDALYKKSDSLAKSGRLKEAVNTYDEILFYRPREFKALENIRKIADEHDIDYKKTPNYAKSVNLQKQANERLQRIDEFLNGIEIGEYDMDYVNGCAEFKDYGSFEEYVRDIIISLMEAYYEYDEKRAKTRVKYSMDNVKDSFKAGEPAYDFAVVYGYSCG